MKNILLVCNDNPIDPLGLMYLIGNTEANFDIIFIKDEFDKRITEKNPNDYDIVGFSTITGSHKIHNKVAEYFKTNPKLVTIMGGPHPTFFPTEALQLSHIDYICVGEGVVAFNKFVKDIKTNNIINHISQYTTNLEPQADIDTLKIDRRLIYSKDKRSLNPIRNAMGTFGCPFNCSYCFNQSYSKLYGEKKRIRYISPEVFVEDLVDCKNKFLTKFIYIQDDTFIINNKWFTKTTNLIKEKVNLPYHAHIRCDLTTEDIVKQLKNTGCKSVTFAIESADINYRKNILNRQMTNEQILNTANLLHKYGIDFRIENMVGMPGTTIKDDLNTLKLNAQCRPTIGWASLFQPYPNTKLGELSKELNLWTGNIDTINSSFFDTSALSLLNKKEVERLQKLFSLGVKFKAIKYLINILIKLPLDNLYKIMYTSFKVKSYSQLYDTGEK